MAAVQTDGHGIDWFRRYFLKKNPLKPTKTLEKTTEGLYLGDFSLHIVKAAI